MQFDGFSTVFDPFLIFFSWAHNGLHSLLRLDLETISTQIQSKIEINLKNETNLKIEFYTKKCSKTMKMESK